MGVDCWRPARANTKIQAYLTAAAVNTEEISGRNRALTHAVAYSNQAVSIVLRHLMGGLFATAPTVSMTNPTDCVEIITSVQRRRRWTASEKVRMVEETFEPGMTVSLVARRHGVAPNQLFTWRRLVRKRAGVGLPNI